MADGGGEVMSNESKDREIIRPEIPPYFDAAGTLLGFVPLLGLPWYVGMVFAGGVSIAAQLGDLAESALKRNAQVKDSGQLIVGHGGVLDRFDSYFLAGVLGYAILLWFGRVPA